MANLFKDEYVPNEEASTGHKKWAVANKGEAAKWAAFRDAAIAHKKGDPAVPVPTMASLHGKALVAAGKLHMSVTDIGSADYPGGGVTPPSGVLRDTFTDFFTQWGYSSSDHNGQIFQNRFKTSNLQTLFSATTPWTATGGAAITEVTDTLGNPGFRFVCDPEMDMSYPGTSSSKKVEIYESNGEGGHLNPNGFSMVRGLGFTDEIAFYVTFPSAGNPNGFPGPNEGVFEYRNIFWQHSMDAANKLILFGVSRLGFTNRFFVAFRDSFNNVNWGPYVTITAWDVALGTPYHFHYTVNWQSGATGSFQWFVQRPTDASEVQILNATNIQTWASTPNTEFGFYSAKSLNNEVVISDIRVTAH